jgi:hypothetical protein
MRIPGFLFFAFVIVVTGSYSQNLITNPGFENDSTGWSTLYTRVALTGLRTIVSPPINGGAKAARINYWGTQDYAQQTQAAFTVREPPVKGPSRRSGRLFWNKRHNNFFIETNPALPENIL